MSSDTFYQYLVRWPGSNFRQLFYKDRKIRADTLYGATIGTEARTPEEVADDFDVPLEAVHEAIDYCTRNEELLRREAEEGLADMRARGLDRPPVFSAPSRP
jgi:uncharacterized protein (DUF433 family)